MAFPRPPRPAALWQDIRQLVATRERHQLVFGALAIVMPVLIVLGFVKDANQGTTPGPQIIYFESWPKSRTDEQIKAQQKIDQAAYHAALAERRREYQKLARDLGIE